jgi:serine/threonine protein kinase
MDDGGQDHINVGSVLRDTYEITGVLGQGGMGTVFLAKHLRLPGKQVAVKVLQVGMASPELHQRFRREAEIVSRLGHPNIVEVLDFNTLEHGTPYLVLEYLRGESLQKRIKRGPVDLETAFSVIRQTGSGLQAAHKAGVVHRDLKPDNVFLVPTDSGGVVSQRVKLLDFGISKMADPDSSLKTRDAVLIGTPQYMAPEQALGKNSEVDARTDVFALGCIVYEMLSGRGPFAGTLVAEVVYRVVHEQPEALEKLCPDLSATIVKSVERAMKKVPAERYTTIGEFVAELTGSPLKSLSHPELPVAPAAVPVNGYEPSGMSLDATMPPSKVPPPKPPSANVAPLQTPPVPVAPAAPPRGIAFWLTVTIGIGLAVGVLGALGYRQWAAASPPPSLPPPPTLPTPAATDERPEPHAPKTEPKPSRERLSPEVEADLTSAERALAQGDAVEAIRLARHSQRVQVSGASFSVLTRAHCLQGDLSNARAQWANVPAPERRGVQRFCKTHGIEL